MPPKKERQKEKEGQKEKKKEFVWTNDEAELLLNIANDYKVSKAGESVDWESVKSTFVSYLLLLYPKIIMML